jgi:hypothetical protein
VSFPVGEREKPGADYIDAAGGFTGYEVAELVAILGRHYAGRVIGKAGENRNIVASCGPMLRQFYRTRGWGAHLRWKVLRDVKDFHRNW